jgi:hypothetical protein
MSSKRFEVYFSKQLKSRLNASIKLAIHFIGSILIKPFIIRPDFGKFNTLKSYKILYVCLANRGDLVVNFPALNALKKYFPNPQITCWLREYNVPLARLNPDIDDVIAYGDSGRSALSLFLEFLGGLKHSLF